MLHTNSEEGFQGVSKTFLKSRLHKTKNPDKNFWDLTKAIAGLDANRSMAAPSADTLPNHFVTKMSNGAGESADYYKPCDSRSAPLSSFKIRFDRVLKCLKAVSIHKASNGVGTPFLHQCASELAHAIDTLFKYMVKVGDYIQSWKIGCITAVHKRGSFKIEKNYRPITVLDNLSAVFEDTVSPQLSSWVDKFTPDVQYGFRKDCGTIGYGVSLSLVINDCLERRGEGVLITTDVAGAFDRSWWAMLKKKLAVRGCTRKALRLLKSYLFKRFLKVITKDGCPALNEILSGVPQGGK